MRRSCLVLVPCCWLLAVPAWGQPPFQWKLRAGQTFYAEREYVRKETVEVGGKQLAQEATSTWLIRFDMQKPKADGDVVQATLVKVRHKVTGAAGKDGLDDKLAGRMEGCVFKLALSPQGRITRLEGYADFLKALAGDKADRIKVLRATFPEEAITEAFGDVFVPLPPDLVKAGTHWQTTAIEPIPLFGSFKADYDFELKPGSEMQRAVVFTVKTTYRKPETDGNLVRVVKGELQGEEGKGSYAFDTKLGRLVRSERAMTVRGNLTLETAGRRSGVRFTSENRVRVKVMEKEP